MKKVNIAKYVAAISSLLCILLGIGFIIAVAHIYYTGGDTPYSRERVGEYLKILAFPSLITILSLILGFIFSSTEKTDSVKRSVFDSLRLILKRKTEDGIDGNVMEELVSIRTSRRIILIAATVLSSLFVIAAIIFLILFCTFTVENLNADVLHALAVCLPLCFLPIAIFIPTYYVLEKGALRECEILKLGNKKEESDNKINEGFDFKPVLTYGILFVGIVLTVVGIINGGMGDVIDKAVKICTECIGLG